MKVALFLPMSGSFRLPSLVMVMQALAYFSPTSACVPLTSLKAA